MSIVWCSISAHGFGHAAQTIPVLNALGKKMADIQVILRTQVPRQVFEAQLQTKWELQPIQQDVGCIQRGPLDIDKEKTWRSYQEFHEDWEDRVDQEARAMTAVGADVVLSNISYLALAAAARAHRPGVGLASLSWDQVLGHFVDQSLPFSEQHREVIEFIQGEYAKSLGVIRLYPAIEMPAFHHSIDTGPSVLMAPPSPQNIRDQLPISGEEKIVLLAFGGVPLQRLPLKSLHDCQGFHFVIGGLPPNLARGRISRLEDLSIPIGDILPQADIVMTKPGYATVMTAIHQRIPLVYVRRHHFADEQRLVDYAERYGQAQEMTRSDFQTGNWGNTLKTVLNRPISDRIPPLPGQEDAAERLIDLWEKRR